MAPKLTLARQPVISAAECKAGQGPTRLARSVSDPIRKRVGSKGRAQQAQKVARIGVLGAATAFRLGLRELEGTNIVITYRSLTHGACNSFAGSQLIVCLPRLNAATG